MRPAVGVLRLIPRVFDFILTINNVVVAIFAGWYIFYSDPNAAAITDHTLGRPIIKVANNFDCFGPAILILKKYVAYRWPSRF